MIALPREAAGAFRAALRRCGRPKGPAPPFVLLTAGGEGLSLSSRLDGLALRLDVPGTQAEDALVLTADALDVPAGNKGTARLSRTAAGRVRCETAEGVTEVAGVDPASVPPFPALPEMTSASPCLLEALREATKAAAKYPTRFALHRVLLRGPEGLIVGGDGRVLFAHYVGPLPWDGDALVPRTELWAWAGLPRHPVSVARTEKQVFVRAGSWTAASDVDASCRPPPFEPLLKPRPASDCLHVDPKDAAALLLWLRKSEEAVGLELGRRVAVSDGSTPPVPLPSSRWTGKACRIGTEAKALRRALEMGFAEFEVRDPLSPLACHDGGRHFVWVASDVPDWQADPAEPPQQPQPPEEDKPVPETTTMSTRPNGGADPPAVDVLAEAEALRSLLRDADARLARLIAGLRQHRKQARAVQAAVASLRQLPALGSD